jgi:hypothetical protein
VKPGGELGFQLATSCRRHDSLLHTPALDDEQRGHLVHEEPLGEIRTLVDRNLDELERVVVATALEHLREVPLGPSAAPGYGRVEEDQARALDWIGRRRGGERRNGHAAVMSAAAWPETDLEP